MKQPKPERSVALRLADIRQEIAFLRSMMEKSTIDELIADPIRSRAAERYCSIISEAARHLPREATDLEPAISWSKIRGIGNVLRHDYEILDEEIVAAVLTNHIAPLDAACARMQERFPA